MCATLEGEGLEVRTGCPSPQRRRERQFTRDAFRLLDSCIGMGEVPHPRRIVHPKEVVDRLVHQRVAG